VTGFVQQWPVTVRVFILDDHEIVRQGLRGLFEDSGEVEVVGEAGTAAEALTRIPLAHPDVAVLDVRLPDGNGIEVCREIRSRHPEIACLMLTSFSDDEALYASVMAGASGYVLKQVRAQDLVADIQRVAAGGSLMDAKVVARVVERVSHHAKESSPLNALSEQERRVLDLIAEGYTNRQIAETLFLAEKTVKNYVTSLLNKLHLTNRTEAAIMATRLANEPEGPGAAQS
jgi:two-component system, NarL family, response regulator DevR